MPMTMSRARVARRIATAAAFGGSGVGLLGVAAVGVLLTEVRLARRTVGGSSDIPPCADGRYGAAFGHRTDRPPLRLGFLGDSTAAGRGAPHLPDPGRPARLRPGRALRAARRPPQCGAARGAVR